LSDNNYYVNFHTELHLGFGAGLVEVDIK